MRPSREEYKQKKEQRTGSTSSLMLRGLAKDLEHTKGLIKKPLEEEKANFKKRKKKKKEYLKGKVKVCQSMSNTPNKSTKMRIEN